MVCERGGSGGRAGKGRRWLGGQCLRRRVLCGIWRRRFKIEFVREGDIAGSAEAADVGAVFVFDAEKSPQAAAANFREANKEGEEGRVLQFGGVDGVEDPVESEDGVEEHGEVVDPGAAVAKDVAEEGVRGVGVTEA